MLCYNWVDDMSVNVKGIDDHNKDLIGIMNVIYYSLENGTNHLVVPEICFEIMNKAWNHFTREEDLMKSFNYPEYEQHKKEHISFLAEVVDLYDKYRFCTSGDDVGMELSDFLDTWIALHIMNSDKKFGQFMQRN
ncbi:MAG: hemerythrin family protein [Nitrospirae bacterium]|nr:hemerythrin family protein [Nitrospirota bacterium]